MAMRAPLFGRIRGSRKMTEGSGIRATSPGFSGLRATVMRLRAAGQTRKKAQTAGAGRGFRKKTIY